MKLKFWEREFWGSTKNKPATLAPSTEPTPQKKDYFKRLVSFFVPVVVRKIKNRQRGLRKGLSRREWEKRNGTKWCLS